MQLGPMTDLPYWLKVLAALSTPSIALLGISIAWAQWATSRSKLVLDLYEHRASAIEELQKPVAAAVRNGASDTDNYFEFVRAVAAAKFLFGKEVIDYLEETAKTLNRLGYACSMYGSDSLSEEDRRKHVDMRHDCMDKIAKFWARLDELVLPYMLMDQRRPWTIGRLFR